MPSSKPERILQTIVYNIALSRRFVDGISYEAFATDERTLYAVIRCLEIVSEASRRLAPDFKARHPTVPWERIAGAGNVYRHDNGTFFRAFSGTPCIIIWTHSNKPSSGN